jgi:hypothetical protein
LYNKSFHPYKTQVKFVLACCILHNWILRHGEDDHVPPKDNWAPNQHDEATPHNLSTDSMAWTTQRDALAAQIWQNRGLVVCRSSLM